MRLTAVTELGKLGRRLSKKFSGRIFSIEVCLVSPGRGRGTNGHFRLGILAS